MKKKTLEFKSTNPLVTIVIAHYRRVDWTLQAIKSVAKQKNISQDKVQIIVSEDGGYDLEAKKKFQLVSKNLIHVRNNNIEGPGGNRQTGLDLVKSEYVMFLDLDDTLRPNFLSSMIKTLIDNPDCQAAVCLSKPKFEPGFKFSRKLYLYLLALWRDIALSSSMVNGYRLFPDSFYYCQLSHMLFRAKALKNFTFNYDYRRGGEDWDLVVSVLKKGPIKIVPKRLLNFRYSPGSSTEDPVNLKKKWNSYRLLTKRLPKKFKKGFFYHLFLRYIGH